jgi:tetratricopeptide (TPR) repeat protein
VTRLVVDRLWPMLLGLAALLAGAIALEGYAARRGNEPLRIAITDPGAGMSDDDEGAAGAAPEGAPASEAHAGARRAARRAQYDAAIPLYERALAQAPGSAAVEGEFGALLLAAGEPERALPHLVRADALAPSAQSALQLGVARRRLGDDAGAERELRRALALRPSYGDARIALGNLLRRRGDLPGAIALLEPAAQAGSNEDRARALVALGAAYLSAGRRMDASSAFERAVLFAPARAEVRLAIARAWLGTDRAEDVQRALGVLGRAAEMAPDVPQVHALLGRAREDARDLPGAAEAYDRALRLDPSYRLVRRRMLRLALQTRDLARARREAERLVVDEPQVPEHHFLAALAADRDGRGDEARRAYRKAIEVAKGSYPEAYLNLGNLERAAGDRAAARAAYEKALALRPAYPAGWLNLAKLHEAAGEAAAAEAAYGKAIEIDAGYASAWLGRGQLRSQQGRTAEAIEDLKRATAARKGYDAAELSLGVAYRRAGRFEEASATYRALLERSPRYVSAWFNLALSLSAAGRPAEAREALRRAAGLDPEHVPTRVALAEVDLSEGRVQEARAGLSEALELDPSDLGARAALALVLAAQGDRRGCEARARQLQAEAPQDPHVQGLAERCAVAVRPTVRTTGAGAP